MIVCSSLLLAAVVGCGGGSTVTGKVTFSDGTPLTIGRVVFDDGTTSAVGELNENGEFSMRAGSGGGIPDGTYRVTVVGAMKEDPSLLEEAKKHHDPRDPDEPSAPLVSLIDPKFWAPTTSGLTCEVTGSRTFDITVEAPGPDYRPLSWD
ncbi:MAG: hypothetical protein Q4C47_08325 [Planctomycetia bacterium]|nr:hypothetical protein [Planctomycetia bacterium]